MSLVLLSAAWVISALTLVGLGVRYRNARVILRVRRVWWRIRDGRSPFGSHN